MKDNQGVTPPHLQNYGNMSSIDAEITYGIDEGSPDGDMTALTIKWGKKLFTFVGEEAEAVQALLLRERLDELKRLDKLKTVYEWLNTPDGYDDEPSIFVYYRHIEERIAELSSLSGGTK